MTTWRLLLAPCLVLFLALGPLACSRIAAQTDDGGRPAADGGGGKRDDGAEGATDAGPPARDAAGDAAHQAADASPGADGGVPANADVPYFYQGNNALEPWSTCQNTSAAMVLAYYGWQGVPDDLTAEFGKDLGQTPAGLAGIFNTIAARSGITQRIVGHDDGVVADVQALLAAGKPVIVHGYFTAGGHVVVTLGFDGSSYTVNDPAGHWSEEFGAGYLDGDDQVGHAIRYHAAPFEAAIATTDGTSPDVVWYHEITP
ncbi:MAG TPA: C39 family peptidase [Polyangia bacterium]|jgi:hypothetical protein